MHTGIIVFALQLMYLTHFFRSSSSLPLSLSLRLPRFSLFFRIMRSRNISGVEGKATNRVRLIHWGISGLSTFLYQVQSSSAFLRLEFVQCLGSSITTDHLIHNNVLPGPGCTLQGILVECGDVASSLWSFVIAAHTFILLAGGPRIKAWIAEKGTSGKARWILCIAIWLVAVFLSLIGPILIRRLYPENGPFCISILSFN
jgi:hypothetical protein